MRSLIALLLLLCSVPAWSQPYNSADFAGGLNQLTTTMRNRLTSAGYDQSLFNCFTCGDPTPVTGHLIYDTSLPILPATGFTNIFSIEEIEGVPDSMIFEVNFGPLQFHLPGVGGPAIQYNNSVYNGIFFAQAFLSPNGTPLLLNMQGGTFQLRLQSSTTATLFNGFLNVGANGLTNVQAFDPASLVPEPETYALMLGGLGLLGFVARRRATSSRPATSSA